MKPDGSYGCCIAFMTKEFAAGDNDKHVDGAVARLIEVLPLDNKNRTT